MDNNNNLCDAHHDWGFCTGKRDVGQNHSPDSRSFGLYLRNNAGRLSVKKSRFRQDDALN